MARRKPFRKCVLREMARGSTKKDATFKCKKNEKKDSRKTIKNEN